jgi:uncharacterized membrane protein YfcA
MEFLLVTLASLLAGFVDAIVGGGGLILLPALFAAYPGAAAATLFGTNKSASIWGSAFASAQYARRVQVRWRALLPAMALSFAGALAGAWLVTLVATDFLRKLLPFVLLAVLVYVLAKKQLGQHHAPRFAGRREMLAAGSVGLVVGFYDGFFGPGTGTFLIVLYTLLWRDPLDAASANAKVVNLCSNLAAAVSFAAAGLTVWSVALPMAAGQLAGSWAGAHLTIRRGQGLVRGTVVAVSLALVVRLAWSFLRG